MSELLSESLRKLQEKWLEEDRAEERSDRKAGRPFNVYTVKLECIDALAPIIASAREQEAELGKAKTSMVASDCEAMWLAKELAALNEPMECGHPKACLEMRNLGTHHISTGAEIADSVCAICFQKEQHSADLRDVAEMAIHGCKRSVEKLCDYPTADSIVREFREKQQKSKEGDARAMR